MITEQELERALELKREIRDLKHLISKIESAQVSKISDLNSTINFDGNKIVIDDYTINIAIKLKKDLAKAYNRKLEDLEDEYSKIVISPEEAFEKAMYDEDEDED